MATFSNRLPSKHDIHLVFVACVFLVHSWAILSLLREVPALVLRMSYWELIAAGAYTLSFALLESLTLLVMLILLSVLLPAHLMRDEFAVKATGVLCISMPWIVFALMVDPRSYHLYLIPLPGCLLSLRLFWMLLRDFPRLTVSIEALLDRLSVLSYLYVTLDSLAVLVVVARNI